MRKLGASFGASRLQTSAGASFRKLRASLAQAVPLGKIVNASRPRLGQSAIGGFGRQGGPRSTKTSEDTGNIELEEPSEAPGSQTAGFRDKMDSGGVWRLKIASVDSGTRKLVKHAGFCLSRRPQKAPGTPTGDPGRTCLCPTRGQNVCKTLGHHAFSAYSGKRRGEMIQDRVSWLKMVPKPIT